MCKAWQLIFSCFSLCALVKRCLNDFIKQYGKCCFEIVDEMYGFHQVEYIGYLRLPKDNELDLIQMSLSMYFNGDIVYETEE